MTPDDLRQALDDAIRRSERAAAATDRLLDRLRRDRLRCVECGSSWDDPTERFRAYLTDEPPDVALFTHEATYQWGPFEEPLRGRDEIRKRWANATDAQEAVSFGYEPLAVTEDCGIARWWVSYVRPVERRRVRLEGIFVLALDARGRCREFREWWNGEEEPVG